MIKKQREDGFARKKMATTTNEKQTYSLFRVHFGRLLYIINIVYIKI